MISQLRWNAAFNFLLCFVLAVGISAIRVPYQMPSDAVLSPEVSPGVAPDSGLPSDSILQSNANLSPFGSSPSNVVPSPGLLPNSSPNTVLSLDSVLLSDANLSPFAASPSSVVPSLGVSPPDTGSPSESSFPQDFASPPKVASPLNAFLQTRAVLSPVSSDSLSPLAAIHERSTLDSSYLCSESSLANNQANPNNNVHEALSSSNRSCYAFIIPSLLCSVVVWLFLL